MATKFKSGADRISVFEEDFDGVCAVLAGPSRWREHIAPNIATAIKKYPGRSFRIVSGEEFSRFAQEPDDMGFTDKIKGEMVLKEIFKGSAATLMVSALHEMVHWVSHPPEQGRQVTAKLFLDTGLMEGLTQVVTEDLLQDQGIGPAKPVYPDRVLIVRKMLERFAIRPFGEMLFRGHVQNLASALVDTYGPSGFGQIRTLATMNNSQKAIDCMERLARASDAKRKAGAAGR